MSIKKIAVISPKGGAGASTFSHVLACFFKKKFRGNTICVDLSYNQTLMNINSKLYKTYNNIKDLPSCEFIIYDVQVNKRNINILLEQDIDLFVYICNPSILDIEELEKFIKINSIFTERAFLVFNKVFKNRKTHKEILAKYNIENNIERTENILKNRMFYETIIDNKISLFYDYNENNKLENNKTALLEFDIISSQIEDLLE